MGKHFNFDRERLATEVLEPLAAGRAGRYRRYDWDADLLAEWRDEPADAVVLLEGVSSTSELRRGYVDYTIWVDGNGSQATRHGRGRRRQRLCVAPVLAAALHNFTR